MIDVTDEDDDSEVDESNEADEEDASLVGETITQRSSGSSIVQEIPTGLLKTILKKYKGTRFRPV